MPITGTEFEVLTKTFFKKLFKDMGYIVLEVRNQTSGTQNGFDIKVIFEDCNQIERFLFLECKYYTSAQLNWSEILIKQIELQASNFNPTGFILLSPLRNLSNINDNAQIKFEKIVKCPVDFWTPDKDINDLFALDTVLYEKIFNKPCDITIDKNEQIRIVKRRIEIILQKSDSYKYSNIIEILDTDRFPDEEDKFKTNLDNKLNSILYGDEEDVRLLYHQQRVNYKIFLEDLQDKNNDLRLKIIKWQDNMRLRAKRLTDKFNIDTDYTSKKFFHEFFDDAFNQLLTFYEENELKDDQEKLLNGIVFELAAECPLNWIKRVI